MKVLKLSLVPVLMILLSACEGVEVKVTGDGEKFIRDLGASNIREIEVIEKHQPYSNSQLPPPSLARELVIKFGFQQHVSGFESRSAGGGLPIVCRKTLEQRSVSSNLEKWANEIELVPYRSEFSCPAIAPEQILRLKITYKNGQVREASDTPCAALQIRNADRFLAALDALVDAETETCAH